ncbi:M13 family metallopeptidase [Sphingomonas oryzagri]|uniref:M13 family metallopeptidase n=1 Tax=Sphingomonas oryzagri TaxID=3042314 RepID=A0ABT6MWH9_9SPHN|nr:M13 family metallopeptidase [Sphingomonas oryzagri]MDH7637227.1 M13 family metallopeptidase [Sphingomonas oryzagri]
MRRPAFIAVSILALAAPLAAQTAPKFPPWGIRLSDMDSAVKPGDDFFRYANGHWLDTTQIAPDRTSAGIDVVLADEAEQQVRAIAEEGESKPTSAAEKQIGDLYASWMDEAGIEKAGTAPLKPYLARIAGLKDTHAVAMLMAEPGYSSPVGTSIFADVNRPGRYGLYVGRGGLGLPGRDYYLLKGDKYDGYRAAYRAYIAKQLTQAGFTDADARAARILALETQMATSQWTPEKERDIQLINNPMTVAKLQALAPQFDWPNFFKAEGFGPLDQVVVTTPDAIQAAGKLLVATPLATWKDYLAFHFISDHAAYLPKAFDGASFDFYGKMLRDQPEQRARWKRGVSMVNNMLGEAVGQIYVERHYPPESDRQMGELIANLRAAYGDEFQHLAWMDDATRQQALAKLATFDPRTGHPKKYIDYSSFKVVRGDMLGNAMRSEKFEMDLVLSRFPKPVDRSLWDMTPQTVNAYYDPTVNQITFPAAILQAPYFDPNADPAVNYGSIGATIGHEMGHGFDDQGRQFDATGKVRDWWTKASADKFKARTAMLGKQFDSYEPVPGVHIKGELTMGENVGDLGGLESAWGAWRRYVATHGDPGVKNGFTADQRFLLAYSYSWQTKEREGALRQQLLTNEHSPAKYRVNGVVRNFDPWYKAFDVKPGDKLYLPPDQRVHIWVD